MIKLTKCNHSISISIKQLESCSVQSVWYTKKTFECLKFGERYEPETKQSLVYSRLRNTTRTTYP